MIPADIPQPLTLRDHLKLPRNKVALALMIAGVLSFAAFHFVRFDTHNVGWRLWLALFEIIKDGGIFADREALLGFSGFLTLAITTVASPLLISWLFQNAWIKWCLVAFSAMAASIMWYFLIIEGGAFMILLTTTPTLTLTGLLFLKSDRPPLPHLDS